LDSRAEKIGRSEFRSEEVGSDWVRKVRQAGAPSGEMPSRWRLETPEVRWFSS